MKQRLLFLGPPGVGKGTQAALLCQKQNLLHLSTGDLLRAEVASQTSLGIEAAEIMNRGELVSDSIVLSIVEKRLATSNDGWLLDGFPRNLLQAEALEVLLEKINQPIDAVLLIELADELLVERLIARGRADDKETVIRHRLEVYKEKTAPLIDHYNQHGLVMTISGEGDIEAISSRIQQKLI
ncbi:adenylate kinase [Prochlorococcus sp. MIT 1307]|uniref:adenylate kinase n=1 Tax=Prochlorococcus sp. MIT 1307 TaxID=3096219 RepID=UPI002A74D2EC|nr:adenylate kinase [Prochlorococcus sp. MIT 1307]